MPQSKQQKRLGALARRERDRDIYTIRAQCQTSGVLAGWCMEAADIAAADVRNLRRKLGIAEEKS